MNRWWSRVAAALLLLAVVIAAVLAVSLYALPLDGTTVTVDGETFSLANISASQAVAAFAVAVVATVAGLIVAAVAIAVRAPGRGARHRHRHPRDGRLAGARRVAVPARRLARLARRSRSAPGIGAAHRTGMTTALIADDERLLREQLRSRLAEVWPELEVVAEAKNGAEAVALTEKHHPDIVFLDIRMPGMTGIEAARAIAQLPVDEDEDGDDDAPGGTPWHGPEIVFITAYDQYAIEAFEQGVVDYVLKPAERERLQVTVERLRKRIAERGAGEAPDISGMQQLLQKLNAKIHPGAAARLRWIQATVGASIQMIPVEEVLFFISDEKYTRVQTATLEALIRKPIKELVEELDADMFWQIHRSTLVNTRAIAGVTRDLRGRQLVAVRGHPEKLEVSRSYAGLFKGM